MIDAGARAADGLPRRLTAWARSRCLAPNSLTGISLTLSACAAAWFSAGTTAGSLGGGLALCACYLAWCGARRLAVADGAVADGAVAGAAVPAAGAAVPAAEPATTGSSSAAAASRAALSSVVSSAAVYAGLAVGGHAAGFPGTWQLAVAAVIMMAVRDLTWECRAEAEAGLASGSQRRSHPAGRAIRSVFAFPFGWRVAAITMTAPVWGARVTLLVLLGWAIVAVGSAIAIPLRRKDVPALLADPLAAVAPAGGVAQVPVTAITVMMPVDTPAPPPATVPAAAVSSALGAPAAVSVAAGPAATLQEIMEAGVAEEPDPPPMPDPLLLRTTVTCRDDGRFALQLGRVVRGQLVPLPPALAGLAATALLAWLGMRNLPGLLLLTPLVVMLLAAFGSAHPHDRGLDWLTPAVLLGGQLLYIAAIGFSFRVPAPLTFTLCALTAVHCASLARFPWGASGAGLANTESQNAWQRAGAGLGWEGRMLIVGAGAMAGVPALTFAALGAYLAAGTGARVLPRYVALPRS